MDSAEKFIGAKGLGAKLLIDMLPVKTDPLSEENILMFTTGPLTGTSVQTSGRGTVITKSPQTGLFLDSHLLKGSKLYRYVQKKCCCRYLLHL